MASLNQSFGYLGTPPPKKKKKKKKKKGRPTPQPKSTKNLNKALASKPKRAKRAVTVANQRKRTQKQLTSIAKASAAPAAREAKRLVDENQRRLDARRVESWGSLTTKHPTGVARLPSALRTLASLTSPWRQHRLGLEGWLRLASPSGSPLPRR